MGIKIVGTITNITKIDEKDFKNNSSLKIQAENVNTKDFLYIKGRVLTCDEPNSNGDFFSNEEVKKTYETFIGGIIDFNHDGSVILGKIIDANYIEGKNEHDYVVIIGKINRKAYKDIVSQIEAGILSQMSLEAFAGRCICSICKHEFDYIKTQPCKCIAENLGRKIVGDDGLEHMVWKSDLDLTFTGLGVVPNPADKKADIFNVLANENKIEEKSTQIEITPDKKEIKSFESEGMSITLDILKESVIEELKETYKIEQRYIDLFDDEIESWVSTMATETIENEEQLRREIAESINKDISRKIEEDKISEEEDKEWEKENKIENSNKEGLNDALKKLNAVDFINILKAIENKNSGKTQSIAMDIMGKAEVFTEKEFYEILSKDFGKLTTIEIEDIKNILKANKKLLSNDYGAYLYTDNGESYWVVEKFGKLEFKKKVSDIYAEDWDKDIKVDDVPLKEYAISGAFKKRLLHTIQCEGIQHVKDIWNIKEIENIDINMMDKIKSRANELGIKIEAEEIVLAMFSGAGIIASETHYVKDKFCDCVKKNMENNEIKLKGKQSRTDAVESFCYGQVIGSRVLAGKQEENIDKIIWKILGGDYCKCVEKNNDKVCAWLEKSMGMWDKMPMSHRVKAIEYENKGKK